MTTLAVTSLVRNICKMDGSCAGLDFNSSGMLAREGRCWDVALIHGFRDSASIRHPGREVFCTISDLKGVRNKTDRGSDPLGGDLSSGKHPLFSPAACIDAFSRRLCAPNGFVPSPHRGGSSQQASSPKQQFRPGIEWTGGTRGKVSDVRSSQMRRAFSILSTPKSWVLSPHHPMAARVGYRHMQPMQLVEIVMHISVDESKLVPAVETGSRIGVRPLLVTQMMLMR